MSEKRSLSPSCGTNDDKKAKPEQCGPPCGPSSYIVFNLVDPLAECYDFSRFYVVALSALTPCEKQLLDKYDENAQFILGHEETYGDDGVDEDFQLTVPCIVKAVREIIKTAENASELAQNPYLQNSENARRFDRFAATAESITFGEITKFKIVRAIEMVDGRRLPRSDA